MNRAIAEFPKPWISLIDGVCMGGGIAVSVHGSHRVVTEHALLPMPDTAIALFPDVGTPHVLQRLPGAPARRSATARTTAERSSSSPSGCACRIWRRGRNASNCRRTRRMRRRAA
jgi:enoyl-CoA hydratase/carnithine racemase